MMDIILSLLLLFAQSAAVFGLVLSLYMTAKFFIEDVIIRKDE